MLFLKVIISDFFSDYVFEVDEHKTDILSTNSTKNTKRHRITESQRTGQLVIVRIEKRLGYTNRVKENQEEMRG